MLRTTSGLSRSVGKWMSQVAASVGATLVATMIYSALPASVVPVAVPQPEPLSEMTSGGKFAARAVHPAAEDGLDTMPLPRMAPLAVPAAFLVAPVPAGSASAPVRQAVWDGTPPLSAAPERPVRAVRPVRPAARVEAKRAVAPAEPAQMAASLSEVTADEGLMPRMLSAARGVWSLTASASGALVARVVPQIP